MPMAKVILKLISITCFWLMLQSCSLLKTSSSTRLIEKQVGDIGVFDEHFSGMAFYDPEASEWLYRKNADKYFTPASNTKLLTYFAAVKTLDSRLDALKYYTSNDTLYFIGTADPTTLHQDFSRQPAIEFLKNNPAEAIVYLPRPPSSKFGSGWAWDDYQYDFQPELSDFPVYGNVLYIEKTDSGVLVTPPFFEPFLEISEGKSAGRSPLYNLFSVGLEYEKENVAIPFITSSEIIASLLSEELGRKVLRNDTLRINRSSLETLAGIKAEVLYRIMMLRSDNFYAEQLNLMGSFKLGFGWDTDAFRNYIIGKHLSDLPQPVIWRDGSGLSRYNLITPESMVGLLEKIEAEVGFDQIRNTFPAGGNSGTIKDWYPGDPPYIYAKTGTLSNNHNLSGFLITKTGRKIIFSLMNNNYIRSNSEIKQAMQQLLEYIRDRY